MAISRRFALALIGSVLVAAPVRGQVSLSSDLLPKQTSLAKLGLERAWFTAVPLDAAEKLTSISLDGKFLFSQTNQGHFFVFDAETGRPLWHASLGAISARAYPASSNSFAVYVTNSSRMLALDRNTGRTLWEHPLETLASSPTACDEDRVIVGTSAGQALVLNARTGDFVWNTRLRGDIQSRPITAGRVLAFGGSDGKVVVSRSDKLSLLYRFSTGGGVVGALGSYKARTLLIPSLDNSLYAIDLFTGDSVWSFASGAPIEQGPLVAGSDVYVVNKLGVLSALDAESDGDPRWSVATQDGRLLSIGKSRVYLNSRHGDLFIVDRLSGRTLSSPRDTYERSDVKIRDLNVSMTNRENDRIYLASSSGFLVCVREIGQTKPLLLRDPAEKPFGYIPPEGYTLDTPPVPEALENAAGAEQPKEEPGIK